MRSKSADGTRTRTLCSTSPLTNRVEVRAPNPQHAQFDKSLISANSSRMKTLAMFVTLFFMHTVNAHADSIYDIKLKDIDGKDTSLSAYKGKVLLVVNVASKCGYTKQYSALEANYQKYKDKGFVVLGFPCNQFGGQEPGSNDEIKEFCSSKFNVTFPLFDKIDVNGEKRHALYTDLAGKDSPFPGDIKWNFNKFLIGKDGKILKRFESKATPDSPEGIEAIEAALAAK
jgi:glutathione peroxidase